MTLEEAIKHAEDKAQCGGKCGEDHAQLALWLKELQERRAAEPEKHTKTRACDCVYRQVAIDALQKEINKGIPPFDDVMGSIRCGIRLARNIIEDLPAAVSDFITCADCRYADEQIADGRHWCSYHEDYMRYCSDAERRQ